MTNWKEIHPDFTPELQREWERRGFNYKVCQSWVKVGCQPQEAELADYLWECKRNKLNGDIEIARVEYPSWKKLGLALEVTMQWKKRDFTFEQTKRWLSIGLNYQNSTYCAWLRNSKKLGAEQVLNKQCNEKQLWMEYNDALAKTKRWLSRNYPNKGTKEINIKEQLEGELDLRGYDNLQKAFISCHVDKNKFEIKNAFYKDHHGKTKETEITQLVNPQEHLQKKYPTKEEREKVKELNIMQNSLEGELNLSDFSNLEELNCSNNYLTNIVYSVNPEKLIKLNVGSNNLPDQDLSVFSKFTNLQELRIGNSDEEKIKKVIYNRFGGSTEPLKNLESLKILEINNTNVDFIGFEEFLPNRIEEFYNIRKWRIEKTKQNTKTDSIINATASDSVHHAESEKKKNFRLKVNIGSGIKKIKGRNIDDHTNQEKLTDSVEQLSPAILSEVTRKNEGDHVVLSEAIHEKLGVSLKLKNFTNLRILTVSFHQITDLDVINCSNLEELNCHDSELTNLKVVDCPSLKKINCSNNYIRELDLSTCSKLEEVDAHNCPNLKIKSNLAYDVKKRKWVKATRNILIIGKKGSGKSALANILLNKKENFEKESNFQEIFKESRYSTGETRSIQSKEVEMSGVRYQIIDTVGFGDANDLTDEETATNIFKTCCGLESGLTQILFVVGGRFTLGEINVYNAIRKKIFDKGEDIARYTTIVRTKFPYFLERDKYIEDLNLLKNENNKFNELINSCNGVIYIDNPSLNFSFDEEEKNINKEIKKFSRSILIEHLEKNQIICGLDDLELINKISSKFMSENKQSDRSLSRLLKEKREEMESKSTGTKMLHKANKGLDRLLGGKITEKEVENSLLEAVIEVSDRCKQM